MNQYIQDFQVKISTDSCHDLLRVNTEHLNIKIWNTNIRSIIKNNGKFNVMLSNINSDLKIV